MTPPTIAISTDLEPHPTTGALQAKASLAYASAIRLAGGVPVFLPPLTDLVPTFVRTFDAFLFSGGDDPRMEPFGRPTHPNATPMHEQRQAFETALLRELQRVRPDAPVLGVCLGMQLMALVAGGDLDQHLPDTLPTHADHKGADHPVRPGVASPFRGISFSGVAHSRHRQAVQDPGALRVLARAHDGVVEAIADPARRFYLGVQWHPERTVDPALGRSIFDALVRAASAAGPASP